jgi:hypothetical protein
MLTIPILMRLARRLEATWAKRAESSDEPWRIWQAVESYVAGACALRQKIRLAIGKNLTLAVTTLKEELDGLLRGVTDRIGELRNAYGASSSKFPDRCEWIKELRQLEDEFGKVEIRWSATVIGVVTEAIVLKGVNLGPFAIEFDWMHDGLSSGSRCFHVRSLQPNVPSGRDDVTHPHVQDDILCAGDAKESLDQAVAEGRLVDAFLMVQSVLTNYNPNSAYVSLQEWDGTQCAQCGRRVASSETYSCEHCECTLCDECAERCEGCDETRCGDCLSPCDICSARHCRGELHTTDANRAICPTCLVPCSRCGTATPKDELSEGMQLCSTCNPPKEDDHDDEPAETASEEEMAVSTKPE